MALQALALYSSLTYKPGAAGATVTLRSGESALRPFQVDSANRLLLQCQPLPAVPGEYSPAVTGTGCVYMQVSLPGGLQVERWSQLPGEGGGRPVPSGVGGA